MIKRVLSALISIAFAGLIAGGGAFFYIQNKAQAPGLSDFPANIRITPGLGVTAISGQLKTEGIIQDTLVFRVWARYTNAHTKLRAGEFAIPAKASIAEILDILESGKTVVRKLTIAEGLTVTQALLTVQDAKGLTGGISLIPEEGWMLPETYHYSWGDRRDDLIARMADDMGDVLAQLWDERPHGFILKDIKSILVLASIVEKETGVAAERPMIAGVFLNRLKKGMRLQSDPTVVYALTDGGGALGRALTRQDWKVDSPYNTYKIKGLPPAPIANPGRASLAAVIHPADTDALYFVADGTGGHVFAKTLKEHNRNVAKWRKIKRQRAP
ncbi:endolytic transglycosylase MltG [Magnetovibrio sp. PR-2]|uniref:endolytic transglycosylase MltG n=1 Tax=Magnetovibrio sp. PR-2 TaxID=3120356 RepID=UPI002FCDF018